MSFIERGQFLPQRGEFVSFARGIEAGSYALSNDKFVVVSHTSHDSFGRSHVKAEILEPQKVSFPVRGRLWRGHSISVDTAFMGRKRPAEYAERYVLIGGSGVTLLDERQVTEPHVGYLSLSHFRKQLKEIPSGAESIDNKDINRILDSAIPFSLVMSQRIEELLTLAAGENLLVKSFKSQPNGHEVTSLATFDLVTQNVYIGRVNKIYSGGFLETTYSVLFQNKNDFTGTQFTIHEEDPLKKKSVGSVNKSEIIPTIADRVKLVETLGALNASYLR